MSDIVRFFMPCIPPKTTHHAKRIVKIGTWHRQADKPELVAAKGLLEELLIPHQIAAAIPSPVAVSLEFTWPWLSNHSLKVKKLGRVPHTSKPDCDNASKTLCDRLVALRFIEDDRGIVLLHVQKWWGDRPGIEVAIVPFVNLTQIAPAHKHLPSPADLFSFAPLE